MSIYLPADVLCGFNDIIGAEGRMSNPRMCSSASVWQFLIKMNMQISKWQLLRQEGGSFMFVMKHWFQTASSPEFYWRSRLWMFTHAAEPHFRSNFLFYFPSQKAGGWKSAINQRWLTSWKYPHGAEAETENDIRCTSLSLRHVRKHTEASFILDLSPTEILSQRTRMAFVSVRLRRRQVTFITVTLSRWRGGLMFSSH